MSQFVFKMPDIGEGIVEAEVAQWRVAVGDLVQQDEPLVDIMTDKATVEITSPVTGVLQTVGCEDGEMLAVGADLAVLDVQGSVASTTASTTSTTAGTTAKKIVELTPAAAAKTAVPPIFQSGSAAAQVREIPAVPRDPAEKPLASPAVRRRAQELGINLNFVPSSGSAGFITHYDLDAFVARGGSLPLGDVSAREKKSGGENIKLVGMRRVIAQRMQDAKRHIPHFSYVEEIDVTSLEELRQHLNSNRSEQQPALTVLPFMVLAIVKAAAKFPQCNATFDDEAGIVTQHHPVHLGIATMTKGGLMVPVLRHVEALDIWQIAAEVKRLSELARNGKAMAEQLSGSTITLTSLGPLGGISTTPVINRPEVGIIGPNKIFEKLILNNGQVVVRKAMNVSSSFDHRVVDGYDAAEMIQYIKSMLEQPATLFMA